MSDSENPQQLAQQCAHAMYARDRACQGLGIKIDQVGPGSSRLTMKVRVDMLNGHDICHGGFIFALADSAFAYACNSYNQVTVAAGCSIDFLAPAREGDLLIAEAVERSLSGRTGVYDISVSRQSDEAVALFRGKSHKIKGQVIPGMEIVNERDT